MNQRLIVKIWLVLGFLGIGAIFLFKDDLINRRQYVQNVLSVAGDNISYGLNPHRTTIGLAAKRPMLEATLGYLIGDFTQAEWKELWDIVYGIYSEDRFDDEGIRVRDRQLTLSEVQLQLAARFPFSFGYFTPSQWGQFWYILNVKE